MSAKVRILFVCLGNICRSPAAEGVLRHRLAQRGIGEDRVVVDSAGTGGWHAGKLPDARMRRHAARRGYGLTSRARQVGARDFSDFDLIVVMDLQNQRDLRDFARTPGEMQRVRLFCTFAPECGLEEVPDPYYGGAEGFEQVLDLVEQGCEGLMREITARLDAGAAVEGNAGR